MPQKPLRIAIVGVNNQGIDHLEAILSLDGIELVALCDTSPQLLKKTARDYNLGDLHLDTGLETTAQRDDIDALVIALPHHLHPFAVDQAVKGGKHLLKEKPIARNLLEAHQMARQMRQAGLVLHTGVQRRHHATYQFLAAALQEHEVQSASIEITIAVPPRDPEEASPLTWRDDFHLAGGGVLIDLGYHGVDLMHFLLGPLELLSCVTRYKGRPCASEEVDDDARLWAVAGSAWISMHFGRGTQKKESLIIDTDKGRFLADRETVRFLPRTAADQFGPEEVLHKAERSWEKTLQEQFLTLQRTINSGDLSTNDIYEELPTMRFLEACYRRRDQGFFPAPRT